MPEHGTFEQYREDIDAMSKFDERRVPMLIELAKMGTIDAAAFFRGEIETSLGDMDDNIYSPAKLFVLLADVAKRKDRRYYNLFPRVLARCDRWADRLSAEETSEVESIREKARSLGAIRTRWWQLWRHPIAD